MRYVTVECSLNIYWCTSARIRGPRYTVGNTTYDRHKLYFDLTLSCITLKNGQAYSLYLKYVWPFISIMHEELNSISGFIHGVWMYVVCLNFITMRNFRHVFTMENNDNIHSATDCLCDSLTSSIFLNTHYNVAQ